MTAQRVGIGVLSIYFTLLFLALSIGCMGAFIDEWRGSLREHEVVWYTLPAMSVIALVCTVYIGREGYRWVRQTAMSAPNP